MTSHCRHLTILLLTILVFVLGIAPTNHAQAQDLYKLKLAADVPIPLIGLGTLIPAFFIDKKRAPLTKKEIEELNPDDVWGFDRPATKRWSPPSAKASDALLYTSMALPLLLAINSNVRNEPYAGIFYVEALLLNMGLTTLTKELARRNRPFTYNPRADSQKKMKKDARKSFFSGHTSMTATSTFFLAKVYADLNPTSKWKPYIWAAAAAIPAVVGVLRFTAGKHFFTDILLGYGVGAAVGIVVPHVHRNDLRISRR